MSDPIHPSLKAWQDWYRESGGATGWLGPCLHGRDPYTRCDTCAELEEDQVRLLAEGQATCGAMFDAGRELQEVLNRERYVAWLIDGEVGVSSATIWEVMTGRAANYHTPGIPADDSDFGRCYELLERFPEWKPRLYEVGEHYPEWKPILAIWDRLTRLHVGARGGRRTQRTRLWRRVYELLGAAAHEAAP
jgi:hypothetical protein